VQHSDVFVLKLDSSGSFIWAKSFGGLYLDDVNSIACDKSSNLYLCGYFRDSVDFDPGINSHVITTGSNGATYLLKLDSSGTFVDVSTDIFASLITTDKDNNIYIAGIFNDSMDIDPGPGV